MWLSSIASGSAGNVDIAANYLPVRTQRGTSSHPQSITVYYLPLLSSDVSPLLLCPSSVHMSLRRVRRGCGTFQPTNLQTDRWTDLNGLLGLLPVWHSQTRFPLLRL